MFIGEYTHSLDEKGRLSVPAKFRRGLTGGVVITRGLDSCLFVYPQHEWQELAQKLAALPLTQKHSRAFARLMLAGAWDAELDAQGRIMLPEYLRQYAALSKQVTVAGLYNRLELWDRATWQTYREATESESSAIAESMAELGI
jgi:MraZ protein